MISIIYLIAFLLANAIMLMCDLLTISMIITTVLSSLWFLIIIYVKVKLSKNEDEDRREYKRDFSFRFIIFSVLIILLVIRSFFDLEGMAVLHLIAFIMADMINDNCTTSYYIIKNEDKYNKLVLAINKLNENFNIMSNRIIFGFVYILVYYIINVVIF